MSEKEVGSEERDKTTGPRDGRRELLVTFIEHGSRPAAALLIGLFLVGWLFSVRQPLLEIFPQARKLKVGSFELELQENAAVAGVRGELQALSGLTDEQLQLFLVIGKSRPHITYLGEEATEDNLQKLQELGIVAEWRREDSGALWWRVSEEGNRLHDIVRNMIFSSIRRSGGA
jgi:hypothetical protein